MVAILDALAPELLLKVVQHCDDASLPSLASTCRVFRQLGLGPLFSDLTVRVPARQSHASKSRILHFCRGVLNHPRIPGCVTGLSVIGTDDDRCGGDPTERAYLDHDTATAIAKLILRLPHLRMFDVRAPATSLPLNVFPFIVHALVCAPNLESVSFQHVHSFPSLDTVATPGPHSFDPEARPISISFKACWPSALSILDAFVHASNRRASAVRHVTVASAINTLGSSTAGFDPALWYRLTTLDLSGFMIDQTKELVLLSLETAKSRLAPFPLTSLTLSDGLTASFLLRLADLLASPSSPLSSLSLVLRSSSDPDFASLLDTLSDVGSFPCLSHLGLFASSAKRRAVMSPNSSWSLHLEALSLFVRLDRLATNLAPSTSEPARLASAEDLFAFLPGLSTLELPLLDPTPASNKTVEYRTYLRPPPQQLEQTM